MRQQRGDPALADDSGVPITSLALLSSCQLSAGISQAVLQCVLAPYSTHTPQLLLQPCTCAAEVIKHDMDQKCPAASKSEGVYNCVAGRHFASELSVGARLQNNLQLLRHVRVLRHAAPPQRCCVLLQVPSAMGPTSTCTSRSTPCTSSCGKASEDGVTTCLVGSPVRRTQQHTWQQVAPGSVAQLWLRRAGSQQQFQQV